MSNYTKTTDFAAKDSLATGNPSKIVRGSEFETEFDAISTAIATKADTAGPTFTGTATFATTNATTVQIGGVAITSTATELNLLDGITGILDEDNMASDSATSLATQQSIKAYVDTTVAATNELVEDTTPQLGGNLDLNSNNITGTGNIDITGTVTADGLTVEGTGDLGTIGNGAFNAAAALGFQSDRAFFGYSSSQNALIQSGASKGVAVEVNSDTLDSGTRAALFASNGDISFYEDTGTTAKLFWDASTERLGIGTTSPSTGLHISNTGPAVTLTDTETSARNIVSGASGSGSLLLGADEDNGVANSVVSLRVDGSEKAQANSTGFDVTGTLTTDTLDVDSVKILSGQSTTPTNDASPLIYRASSHSSYANGDLIIQARSSASRDIYMLTGTTTPVNRLQVNGNGDISFYEDTGTTAKLFWDASGEVLGLGTASPSATYSLDISKPMRISGTAPQVELVETDASSQRWSMFGLGGDLTFRDITNNVYAMTLESSTGNVGIGTNSPATTLEVASGSGNTDGATNSPTLRITNQTNSTDWDTGDVVGTLEFYTTDSSGNAPYDTSFIKSVNEQPNGTLPSGALTFGAATYNASGGAVERMRIDSTGNVGIGTTSPGQLLDVAGATAPTIRITNTDTTLEAAQVIGALEFKGSDSSEDGSDVLAAIKALAADTTPDSELAFFTLKNVGSQDDSITERMRIDQDGNVGIGTSNPSVKGHIAYTTEATANRAYGLVVNGNDTGTAGESASIFLGARDNTVRGTSIAAEFQSSSGDHDLIFSTSAASSAPSERMRIDSSGNVLVGTTETDIGYTDSGAGVSATPEGYVQVARSSGNELLYLNKLDNDGDVIRFSKDGTEFGTIKLSGGNNLSISGTVADHSGVLFGTHVVFPLEAGSLANGTISLGDSSYPFKDIFLSGTVDGGNGSASAPTFTFGSDTNTGMFRVEANTLGFSTNGAEEMRLTAAGDLHVDGNVIAYSTTISDRRLKSDITNISDALNKVGQINGVTFVRDHNGEKAAGVVAQEIMEVLPEAVKSQALPLQTGDNESEYYVVEYDAVTGLLVEAVKELKARVEALEAQ